MNTTTEMELISVDELVPYANNTRTHTPEQIMKLRSSFREFGVVNPIIIDRDYNVIAGHARLEAAKAEGIEEVPCVFADHLTPTQKKAYIIADNRMALDAGWDEELLSVELESLNAEDFDLSLTGFEADELESYMIPAPENESGDGIAHEELPEDDDFDLVKALEKANFVNSDELWYVGRHKLYCGDSTKKETYELIMDGSLADLVVTDPPYNVSIESEHGLKVKNDKMQNDEFYDFLFRAFSLMHDYTIENASIYVFHAAAEVVNFTNAYLAAGFKWSQTLIWNKNIHSVGRKDYHWKHEPIIYGWKQGCKNHRWFSDRAQTTVWNFKRPNRADTHPTAKPIDLIAYPIVNSSQEGEIVLDPFGGSGSTLMACEETGRICYTMEYDPKYASCILRRYAEKTNNEDEIYCIRDGKKVMYADVMKEVTVNAAETKITRRDRRKINKEGRRI